MEEALHQLSQRWVVILGKNEFFLLQCKYGLQRLNSVGLVLRFEYEWLGTRSSAPMYANYTSYVNLDFRNQFLPSC